MSSTPIVRTARARVYRTLAHVLRCAHRARRSRWSTDVAVGSDPTAAEVQTAGETGLDSETASLTKAGKQSSSRQPCGRRWRNSIQAWLVAASFTRYVTRNGPTTPRSIVGISQMSDLSWRLAPASAATKLAPGGSVT